MSDAQLFDFEAAERPLFLCPKRSLRPLWKHQETAIESLRAALRAGKTRPLLMAPTGSGKTTIAARMTANAIAKGKRVLFVSPYETLVDQTRDAFEAEGIRRIGIMQASRATDPQAMVQVGTVQTLARREKPDVGFVFVDEAHRVDKALFAWMKSPEMASVPFVGLSATPFTAGLGRHYNALIIAATTRQLIDEGRLSRYIVYAPSEPDLAAVRVTAGDYNEGELSAAMNTPKLVGDIIENWHGRARDLATIVFCVDRKHAQAVEQRFREAGVASEYLDGETPRFQRKAMFARFKSGETKVLVNIDVLTAGFDSDVRCVIDARPTKSQMRYVQALGRGLRTAAGKDKLVILDHAGNVQRLGLVCSIHHDKLDMGDSRKSASRQAERKPVDVRICSVCRVALPRASLRCDACGHEKPAATEVVETDAQLVEFGSKSSGKKPSPTRVEMAAFYGELKGFAAEKGYKERWSGFKFKEKFGFWPDDPDIRNAPKRSPGLKVKQWVLSRQIAFSRGRRHG